MHFLNHTHPSSIYAANKESQAKWLSSLHLAFQFKILKKWRKTLKISRQVWLFAKGWFREICSSRSNSLKSKFSNQFTRFLRKRKSRWGKFLSFAMTSSSTSKKEKWSVHKFMSSLSAMKRKRRNLFSSKRARKCNQFLTERKKLLKLTKIYSARILRSSVVHLVKKAMEARRKCLEYMFTQQKLKFFPWRDGGNKTKKFRPSPVLHTSSRFICNATSMQWKMTWRFKNHNGMVLSSETVRSFVTIGALSKVLKLLIRISTKLSKNTSKRTTKLSASG